MEKGEEKMVKKDLKNYRYMRLIKHLSPDGKDNYYEITSSPRTPADFCLERCTQYGRFYCLNSYDPMESDVFYPAGDERTAAKICYIHQRKYYEKSMMNAAKYVAVYAKRISILDNYDVDHAPIFMQN